MTVPNQTPTRHTSGWTTDFRTQPFGNMGCGNPLFYHIVGDDFDQELAESGYTKTTTGNGTVALTPGDGGLALFTTNSSTPATTDVASLQLPVAGFTLTSQKRHAWVTRIALSDVINAAFIGGIIQTTATPFTVTDGVYISKASGSTNVFINSMSASVLTQVQIPIAAVNLVNAQFIDFGIYISPVTTTMTADILAYVGSVTGGNPLVGWVPSQAGGARGAVARLTGPSFTTATLNPTLAIQSGTATSKTMTADFWQMAKER